MFGNGVVIGIVVAITHQAHQLILPDRHQALTACFVGGVGTTMLSPAECRVATAASRTSASSTTAASV